MINLILFIIVVGVLLWVVETMIPMDQTIKVILRVVVVVALILYLLAAFGIWPDWPVPRMRGGLSLADAGGGGE